MTCWVTSSAMWALAQMPGVATEPLLDAYDGAQSSQMRAKLLEALGRLKRDDERIVDRLVAALEVGEPARYLAHIGGQRAIDALADAFHRAVDVVLDEDSHQLARRRGIGDAELQRKLEDANFIYRMLEHTGYEPDSEMLHVAEQFKTLEMDLFDYRDWLGGTQKPHRAQEKPGRNDPCWCGSGKKYKKCHLRKD